MDIGDRLSRYAVGVRRRLTGIRLLARPLGASSRLLREMNQWYELREINQWYVLRLAVVLSVSVVFGLFVGAIYLGFQQEVASVPEVTHEELAAGQPTHPEENVQSGTARPADVGPAQRPETPVPPPVPIAGTEGATVVPNATPVSTPVLPVGKPAESSTASPTVPAPESPANVAGTEQPSNAPPAEAVPAGVIPAPPIPAAKSPASPLVHIAKAPIAKTRIAKTPVVKVEKRPRVQIARIEPLEDFHSRAVPGAREEQEWDIREAVFRYQFDHNTSSGDAFRFYFIFLGLKGDAPANFIARFKGNVPEVLPASEAASQDSMRVIHKSRPGRGLLFKTNKISWLDADTVDVDGGFYESQMSLSGDVYRVQRTDSKWVVVRDKRLWTSLGRY